MRYIVGSLLFWCDFPFVFFVRYFLGSTSCQVSFLLWSVCVSCLCIRFFPLDIYRILSLPLCLTPPLCSCHHFFFPRVPSFENSAYSLSGFPIFFCSPKEGTLASFPRAPFFFLFAEIFFFFLSMRGREGGFPPLPFFPPKC